MGAFLLCQWVSVGVLSQALFEFFSYDNIVYTTDIQWCSLMEFGWLDIEDTGSSVCCTAASLFADKCKRVGFVHESKLSAQVFC